MMSQAALNTRARAPSGGAAGHRNGTQLVGIALLLMVLGALLGGGWVVINGMKDTSRLPLSTLIVTGERHYTTDDDIRQTILALGSPGTLMTQDITIIQQQIEHLPWIQQVNVGKQWPDTLRIHVVEYVPFARWNDLHMVDVNGKSFILPTERMGRQELPLFYGPEGSEQQVVEGYQAFSKVLAASKFTLKTVVMSARHSWQLVLDDGVRVVLGRDDPARHLQRFVKLYPVLQQQANRQISYVDLRYSTGVAVGWAAPAVTVQ